MALTLAQLQKAHREIEDIFQEIEQYGDGWVPNQEVMDRFVDAHERANMAEWLLEKAENFISNYQVKVM